MSPGLDGCPDIPKHIAGCLTPAGAKKLRNRLRSATDYSNKAWQRCRPRNPASPQTERKTTP